MVLSSSGGECKLGVRHIESKWMKLWWLCEKPVGEQEMARAQIEVGGQLVRLQGQNQQGTGLIIRRRKCSGGGGATRMNRLSRSIIVISMTGTCNHCIVVILRLGGWTCKGLI